MKEKADPYLKLSSPFDSICVICETELKGNKSKLGIILKYKQNDGRK